MQLKTLTLRSPWAQTGCPVCGGHDCFSFFSLNNYPVSVGILYDTQTEVFCCPTGDINLSFCNSCSFIGSWSYRTDDTMHFGPSYDITLHHSPTYNQFIKALVDCLINSYGIKHKTIVDIGCGKAEFLQEICKQGKNRGIGIDPSAPLEIKGAVDIKLIRDFYSERYADLDADLVCCRHILKLVPNAKDLLLKIRQDVGRSPDTVIYLETPNAEHIFKEGGIWSITYPDTGYFYPEALTTLAQQTGFEVLRVAPCYNDDQYLGIDLRPADNGGGPIPTLPNVEARQQEIELFRHIYQAQFSFWHEKLRQLLATGKRVVAWCSSTRAISFFCSFGIRDEIPFVVDINPNRQGKFLPVTGQKVVAPEFLTEFPPNTIIVSNDTYLS